MERVAALKETQSNELALMARLHLLQVCCHNTSILGHLDLVEKGQLLILLKQYLRLLQHMPMPV